MQVLSIKKYNAQQTAKWREDHSKALSEGRQTNLPQLAFYIFDKNNGFVAFDEKTALWNKTKKGVIAFWETEEAKKKTRGW